MIIYGVCRSMQQDKACFMMTGYSVPVKNTSRGIDITTDCNDQINEVHYTHDN